MADAYGLIWPGETKLWMACTQVTDIKETMDLHKVRAVPLMIETPKARHADELYQVLKDLTGLAKLAASTLNTYQAALRNADELLKQIERESTQEVNHVE